MFNVPQIQARLAGMSQQQLFQEGQANQNDALMFSLVNNENMRRQKAKQAMLAQQAGQQQPPVKEQDLMAMAPTPAPNMGSGIPLQGAGSPQQMAQNQLPEEQGIGALPAKNLQGLAGGGITGYSGKDGSVTGSPYPAGFDQAWEDLQRREDKYGTGKITHDTGGMTKYGISKNAYPNLDIANLTRDEAKKITKRDYWDVIKGDDLAAKDPKFASAALDTMFNHRYKFAKQAIQDADGDIGKLVSLRGNEYQRLVDSNPDKYAPYAQGWNTRLKDITQGAIPSAQANETPTSAAAAPSQPAPWYQGAVNAYDALKQKASEVGTAVQNPTKAGLMQLMPGVGETAYNILGAPVDVAHQVTKVFGNTTPSEETVGSSAYFKKKATELGIRPADPTDPAQRGYRTLGELGGMFLTPTNTIGTAASLEGKLGAAGEKVFNKLNPTNKISPEELAALTAKNNVATPTGELPLRLTGPSAPLTGEGTVPVTSGKQGVIASQEERTRQAMLNDAMDRAAAQKVLPDVANLKEPPTPLTREQLLNTGRAATASIPLTDVNNFEPPVTNVAGPGEAGWGKDLGQDAVSSATPVSTRPDSGLDAENGLQPNFTENTPTKGGRDWNDFLLNMGLGLLAGKSPYALQNVGEAGLGALRQEQEAKMQGLKERQVAAEERKAASEEAYQKALGAHYGVTPEIQLVQAMRDPEFAKQYQSLVSAKAAPATTKDLIDSYMKTLNGKTGDFSGFQDFVQQMSQYTGTMPSGVKVTKRGD